MIKKLQKLAAASLMLGAFTFTPNMYSLPIVSVAHAEVRTYTGIGEDYSNDMESPETAKMRARAKAIKNAIEQAGVILTAYSHSQNFNITANEINIITSNTYQVVSQVKYKKSTKKLSNNFTTTVWQATVDVNVDNLEIQNWLKRDESDKFEIIRQNEESQKLSAENEKQLENLRKEWQNAKTQQEKLLLKTKFGKLNNNFLANQEYDDGLNFDFQKNYLSAIEKYSAAIKLNPDFAAAYNNRGVVYLNLKEINNAISDLNKAIELDPTLDLAYNNRGNGYFGSCEYELAKNDYKKAIELNPNENIYYYNRGLPYKESGEYEKAIADFTKTIEMNPNHIDAYGQRGYTYAILKNYRRAIADLSKYIEMAPYNIFKNNKISSVYDLRGRCYKAIGENEKAQADFDKSEQLRRKMS